jgi:hypothetical protein
VYASTKLLLNTVNAFFKEMTLEKAPAYVVLK